MINSITIPPSPNRSDTLSRAYGVAYQVLAPELSGVAHRVSTCTARIPSAGGVAARHLAQRPGKMLRPVLLGLCHRALGGPGGPLVARASAVVETIHLATLLHDDVVDQATVRRGGPAANAVVGNAAAVLGGDALVVAALTEAQALGGLAAQRALEALTHLVDGELLQLEQRRNVNITPEQALQVARCKTGALMRLCAELAVLTVAGESPLTETWGAAFERVGVAFQILDDLLDLQGDAAQVGKNTGADLAHGTVNYPVALALAHSPLHARALAAGFVRQHDVLLMGRLVSRAVQRSNAVAQALAQAQLELIPAVQLVQECPPGRARAVLLAVLNALPHRTC